MGRERYGVGVLQPRIARPKAPKLTGALRMDNFSLVIGKIYEAFHHPDCWNEVMEELCKGISGARSALIYRQDDGDLGRKQLGYFALHGDCTELDTGAALTNIYDAGNDSSEGFRVFRYHLLLGPENNDKAAGRRALGDLSGKYLGGDSSQRRSVNIMIQGIPSDDKFNASAHRALECLGPHIERAVRLLDERRRLRLRQTALQSALSKLVLGLIIVGPDNQVIFQNPTAALMLSQHKGLSIQGGRLRAHLRVDQERLHGMLSLLAETELLPEQSANHLALAVRHPQRSAPLAVMLAPLTDGVAGGVTGSKCHRGCVALYLSCADVAFEATRESVVGAVPGAKKYAEKRAAKCARRCATRCATADILHALYQLSPAEAAIAISLSNGLTVTEISQRHNVAPDTVRTQLKSVFMKMGVNKQQDVIRVLLGGALSVQQGGISHGASYVL